MAERLKSADELINILQADPSRIEALKENPIPELKKLRDEAIERTKIYESDPWVYRIAIIVLSSLALTAAIGSIILVASGKTIPEVLVALGSTAVGALVGLFAPSPSSK